MLAVDPHDVEIERQVLYGVICDRATCRATGAAVIVLPPGERPPRSLLPSGWRLRLGRVYCSSCASLLS